MTIADLIRHAFLNSGAISLSQTIYAEDMYQGLNTLNNIVAQWQINRWLVYDLVDVPIVSTAATSYTVGPTGTFVFADNRPDKIDAMFATLISTGVDTFLYPFMSREGYNRFAQKSVIGPPLAYFYDPSLGANGTVFLAPVADVTYELHVNAKASLGVFTAISQTISLPAPYIAALTWNLAAQIRSTYRLPVDTVVTANAADTLAAITNSIAQVPQAVKPRPSDRSGIYAAMPRAQPEQSA